MAAPRTGELARIPDWGRELGLDPALLLIVCGETALSSVACLPQMSTKQLKKLYEQFKASWKTGKLSELGAIASEAHRVLSSKATFVDLGALTGVSGSKEYGVFTVGARRSRPYLKDFRFEKADDFDSAWSDLTSKIDSSNASIAELDAASVDKALYAATHAFACVFEVLDSGSRGSNGKLFEYATALVLRDLLDAEVASSPRLSRPPGYVVPVDIVLRRDGAAKQLVVATKITSRERLVQAFVHNHFLIQDKPGSFTSIAWCGSETNAIKKPPGLQETCVHHQVNAYCEWLSPLDGLYYLDLPAAYANSEFAKRMPVQSIGSLLVSGVGSLLE